MWFSVRGISGVLIRWWDFDCFSNWLIIISIFLLSQNKIYQWMEAAAALIMGGHWERRHLGEWDPHTHPVQLNSILNWNPIPLPNVTCGEMMCEPRAGLGVVWPAMAANLLNGNNLKVVFEYRPQLQRTSNRQRVWVLRQTINNWLDKAPLPICWPHNRQRRRRDSGVRYCLCVCVYLMSA